MLKNKRKGEGKGKTQNLALYSNNILESHEPVRVWLVFIKLYDQGMFQNYLALVVPTPLVINTTNQSQILVWLLSLS